MDSEGGCNCLFQHPWWLDAVAPGQWDEVRIMEGGQVVARLPFFLDRSGLVLRLGMPPMTQTLGPWCAPGEGRYGTRLGREMELMEALIERLPPEASFRQNFHFSLSNWLPFAWRGFSQTTRYTYRMADTSNLDGLWDDFLGRARTEIRKGERQLVVRDDLGGEELLRVLRLTFTRQNKPYPFEDELVHRVFETVTARGAGKALFAEDGRGRVHAAALFVWGEGALYYLQGGADPALRNSGAQSLLVWHGLQLASRKRLAFDFEGSMLQPVELFFRSFGAVQTPYFHVWRELAEPSGRPAPLRSRVLGWLRQ